ncbi:MAG TPA: GNAT family N-acetyltransferase [Jiangellaceae bacterium]|jgi:GNAT superfamily N-acetyltransferase|nr:GNAT family N-acetyltransferase [Jiangellaceae bacterium]
MSTARPADPRVSVRRVGPEDWEVVRDLRLRALRDAPAAFESTYEGEQGRSGKEWRAWLTRPTGVTVVATLNGQPAGLAGGYVEEAGHVELVSMWVTPSARGSGMADALVAEVVHWARMRDVHEVRLWVTRGNDVAERLYSRHGFVRSGQAQPLPPTHPCVDEIGMRLVLSNDHQTRARSAEIQMEVE